MRSTVTLASSTNAPRTEYPARWSPRSRFPSVADRMPISESPIRTRAWAWRRGHRVSRPEDVGPSAAAFGALVVAMFALIVLGALVRAHGAGLACPDWPLCFGEFVPRMNLRVAFEWSHRVLAGQRRAVLAALGSPRSPGGARARATRCGAGSRSPLAAARAADPARRAHRRSWLASWTVTAHLIGQRRSRRPSRGPRSAARERARRRAAGRRPATPGPPRAPRRDRAARAPARARRTRLVALCGARLSRVADLQRRGLVPVVARGGRAAPLCTARTATCWSPRSPRSRSRVGSAAGPRRLAQLAAALGVVQVVVGIANVLAGIPVELTGLHSALAAALVLTAAAARARGLRGPVHSDLSRRYTPAARRPDALVPGVRERWRPRRRSA